MPTASQTNFNSQLLERTIQVNSILITRYTLH